MNHAQAVIYAGAIADGELEALPKDARSHIETCPLCAKEVASQRALHEKLVDALDASNRGSAVFVRSRDRSPWGEIDRASGTQRTLVRLGGIAAAVLLVVGIGVGLLRAGPHRPTGPEAVMTEAAQRFGRAPDYASGDATAINGWLGKHNMNMQIASLPDETPVGLRIDSLAGEEAVTFVYTGARGTVELASMLSGGAGSWPAMKAEMISGRAVALLSRTGRRMVLVAPSESELTRLMEAVP